ncbi:MAG: NAD-dependent epimerase/dehydratase family protein, partial [Chloroflexi bacterium]|nr:NAD-dependent epimerase/dehydratase family protein [Chloroflexota bacterium]
MKALVTGATGFIGSNVARALWQAGFQVKALLREDSSHLNIRDLDLELAYGDIRDASSVDAALEGCESVFHVAAFYTFWARDTREIYRTNVEGTRNIMEGALRKGIGRVVYTSTVSTIRPPAPGQVSNEEAYPQQRDLVGHYKRSKYQAEQVALDFCQRGLEVEVV